MVKQRSNPTQQNNTVQTYTNTGNGGGTGYYINLGGIKLVWGQSTVFSMGAAANISVSYPSGFFTTVQFASLTPVQMNTTAFWTNLAPSSPTTTGQLAYEGATGTTALAWFAMGV